MCVTSHQHHIRNHDSDEHSTSQADLHIGGQATTSSHLRFFFFDFERKLSLDDSVALAFWRFSSAVSKVSSGSISVN